MKVFVTGATGLVGSHLVKALVQRGDRVLALSRKPLDSARFGPNCEGVVGDPAVAGPWLDRVAECDAVVHLAGENIGGKRWSDEFMKRIRESRVRSTQVLAEVLAKPSQVKVWISGSAMGYYGSHGDEWLTETDRPGTDFLAQVCVAWEAATAPALASGMRICHCRTGHVLDAKEGLLPRMVVPFRLFAGGPIASGKQWLSWIHIDDMTAVLLFALDTPALTGPFNAVAPNPVRNREFARALGKVLHRPYWFPVPKFALRIAVGRMSEVIAAGQRIEPRRLKELGFQFRYPDLEPALRNLLEPAPAGISS